VVGVVTAVTSAITGASVFSSTGAQESIRPKANAKIVGKKRNFSFFIEPKYALGT